MLSVGGRKPAAVVVDPLAKSLLQLGIRPNQVTIASAVLSVLACCTLIPTGHLFAAAITIAVFTAFDLIDGTMARMSRGGTSFGATLDASCDRITDGALFAAILWWLVYSAGAPRWHVAAALIVLVSSQVISYVKARAEAGGLPIVGGIVERAERLLVSLIGLGLTGLGVSWALPVALWLLAVGSVATVIQRLLMAKRSKFAQNPLAPPPGAHP
ncbi:phosphatidylinositol phosphate synthase [Corynebacterium choanae]|uniref:Phosphatidylinositol phosphate synthase n=1 Tax=Corynebacterium choanae TaxID=1862358 RepID=A0A3G6J7B6_9CORY|nr:CDP-alcohol phosphatidyltransferase family protein [Corynebacterium choanae]AZA13712.1 CDP-diacylglycerol--inositol 3-phosphatidyltransferase [Corynebacterium choanae]